MKLEIRKNGDPILRGKTAKIKDSSDKQVQELISCMLETMRANNGVGLAAPQVGSNLRLCVIEADGETYVLINPKITSRSKNKIVSEEGCLSFPGQFFPISRCAEVQVRYTDQTGKETKVKGRGLLARALQHEIDHLDGILIIDRMKKKRKASNPQAPKKQKN
ncbi:MAG TPA: peptide deformylase [Patescibacteria group bacterium]